MEKNYKDLKTLNPKLPILIRESRGVEPQLWVRYGKSSLFLAPFLSFEFSLFGRAGARRHTSSLRESH